MTSYPRRRVSRDFNKNNELEWQTGYPPKSCGYDGVLFKQKYRFVNSLKTRQYRRVFLGTRMVGCHVHEVEPCRCNANECCRLIGRFAVWAFGTNASFKPPWYQRSLICITANLIFLTTFLIKQKSSRPAAESEMWNNAPILLLVPAL